MSEETNQHRKHGGTVPEVRPNPIARITLGLIALTATVVMLYAFGWFYVTLGAGVVQGYASMAGDTLDFDRWTVWAWIAPVFVFTIFFTTVYLDLRFKETGRLKCLAIGMLPAAFALLPVWFNLISKLCGSVGLTWLDKTFYALRYHSLWLTAVIAFIGLVFYILRHNTKDEEDEGERDFRLASDADHGNHENYLR